eukprot:TRINITY_DN38299_c0_g1_i1.p1 TRINITY_DN38299_c0_g1~~TRINITY_DN38299_c0_g1_i1.p1  ORF type:complete len:398 (+),score=115.92 TRINITY_DN38299_c0_g1_i1:51-1244(+)
MGGLSSLLLFHAVWWTCMPAVHAGIDAVMSGVTELRSPEELEATVGGQRAVVLLVYAPWCPHSQAMAATLSEAAKALAENPAARSQVQVAKIDGNFHATASAALQIERFPTILLYKRGSKSPVESIDSYMSAVSLLRMLEMNFEGLSLLPKPSQGNPATRKSFVTLLNSDTLGPAITGGRHSAVLVQFLAKSDEKSRQFSEGYLAVAQAFAKEDSVLIAACDIEGAPDVRRQHNLALEEAPYFLLFRGGARVALDRAGLKGASKMPTTEMLVGFVNAHAGTHRSLDGGLAKTASVITEIASAVHGDFSAESVGRGIDAAATYLEGHPDHPDAVLYKRALSKILDKGPGFPEQETARLEGLIQQGKVPEAKIDVFMRRLNVLRSLMRPLIPESTDANE